MQGQWNFVGPARGLLARFKLVSVAVAKERVTFAPHDRLGHRVS
jgi:hypothetical protein